MTMTATHRVTIVPPLPPSTPRLCLVPVRAARAVLDGGWWPRSADPIAEVPGLVLALGDHFGVIRGLMLNRDAWDSRPRRLAVDGRVIRLGWFASVDPALVIASTERGDQLDLLVVPAHTPEAAARTAMSQAADPANTIRAPDILAAIPARLARQSVAATARDTDARAAWDNEGGHLVGPDQQIFTAGGECRDSILARTFQQRWHVPGVGAEGDARSASPRGPVRPGGAGLRPAPAAVADRVPR